MTKKMILKYIDESEPHTYEYEIDMIQNITDSQSKNSMNMSLPGISYRKNIMMGVSGQEADISINFKIHNDGTDKSNGTISSSSSGNVEIKGTEGNGIYITEAKTVPQQIFYIKDHIQNKSFTASWKLYDPDGDFYGHSGQTEPGIEVFFADMDLTIISRDSPRWKDCRLDFNVGEGV